MMSVQLEILESSYWEHYKSLKDLSMYLPLNHPKRLKLDETVNEILKKINNLKDQIKNQPVEEIKEAS